MRKFWWRDHTGTFHGPVLASTLSALLKQGSIGPKTIVRDASGTERPLSALALAEGSGLPSYVLAALAGALLAFIALFIAIFAPVPISTVALTIFVVAVLALSALVGRLRQVGLMFATVLLPAAVGTIATLQQPWLLAPLTGIACEPGQVLQPRREQGVDHRHNHHGERTTFFWMVCAGAKGEEETSAPLLVHMLGLAMLFSAAHLVGRASSAGART
jgi:hypothetical protein